MMKIDFNETKKAAVVSLLIEMINASEAREDDESFENPIDVLFKELEERNPDHFAVRQYLKYNLPPAKLRSLSLFPAVRGLLRSI